MKPPSCARLGCPRPVTFVGARCALHGVPDPAISQLPAAQPRSDPERAATLPAVRARLLAAARLLARNPQALEAEILEAALPALEATARLREAQRKD